jgi:Ca-activated chloride channel family protein
MPKSSDRQSGAELVVGVGVRTATSTLLIWFATMPFFFPGAAATVEEPQATPRFRSSVQMVRVAATVRDRKGRLVRDLSREDLQVLDRGTPREIEEFRIDTETPVSLALLFDESGSMAVSSKVSAAREAAEHLIAALDPRRDEVGVFAFDASLRSVVPFTDDFTMVRSQLDGSAPFGTTALFDAIGGVAELVAERPGRRAIVVLTDGVDTASRLRPEDVSAAASAIDVPVYVLAVLSPVDHVGEESAVLTPVADDVGDLANMARWTGGQVYLSSAPAHTSIAAREIIAELRHQYLIAFEAGAQPGWHPIEIRVRQRGAVVRARSGYVVRQVPSSRG